MRTAVQLGGWLSGAAAALLMSMAPSVGAQESRSAYPNAPLTFVVPFGAGTTDRLARFAGNYITSVTGQRVIVENKAGADGLIGIQQALKQPADGYTVVVGSTTTHAANTSLFKSLSYDPVADFEPVAGLAEGGLVLVVRPDFPANTVQELTELAKKDPGKYSYGSGSSTGRFGGEFYQQLTGTELLHVPYKSVPAALADTVGGQIDMIFADLPAAMSLIKAGRLKALGVSTKERVTGLDDIPTIAEQGIPDYAYVGWIAVFAKKGTPKEAIDKLNSIISEAMKTEEAKDMLAPLGWSWMKGNPEELTAVQVRDTKMWSDLVKSAGIERK